ncbi:L-threonylcarbamoyladenylate synthase [Candidatus Nanohalovita haloferacivicina]|uniref:L-threonylcarbamoyladenylate synthase n=1 Tax=Candidatus Nanohalovita haloferacivicina TaxID=2978046 RepID=UPI00325F9B05|nr:L-threonylcarbamoyladenylate synthase [Candidatus Nanohalobia archaeon BNXNv]
MGDLEKQIEEAREEIEKGGIVVFPTETAYGIAADATNRIAIEKVYEAKKRPRSKGLTAIVDSLETAEKYAELSEYEKKVVREFMPGPLTLVAEKKDSVPDNLNKDFAFRISSAEVAAELSQKGPITATSANISGNETSYSVDDISEKLLEKADYVIDAGKLEDGPTSTIAAVIDGEVEIFREGPIKKNEIEKVL